ncbi:MAG: acetylglutamate kinase [Gemmatimonadetes bacterium]|nr:acetylglutamate kinase [Gemmatimonadota bacterium]
MGSRPGHPVLTVVKVGGAVAGATAELTALAAAVAALPGRRVVVHGGGSEITAWQERLGLPVVRREGLRVTTPETMQITAMVLSGWVNKRVVAALLTAGELAVGLSGEDGALLRAIRKYDGRIGEVGEIVEVDPRALRALLDAGMLPVVSPVSRGPAGAPLNVNADEAAIALAVGLAADRLLLVSDVPGVLVDGVPLERMTAQDAADLLERGVVQGGMAVKVRQALDAARAGVEVRIGNGALLDDVGAGTLVVPAGAAEVAS